MENRGPQVLAVNVLFFVLSWVAVGLRTFVRAFMRRIFGLDDWLMVATQVFFTAYCSCQLGGVVHGTGRHLSDLTTENAEIALHFWWFCEVFYVISACLLKISVAVFLLRITIRRVHIWILRLLMAGTFVFGLFYFFLAVLQCRPISNWWTIERKGCSSDQVVVGATYCASIVNAVADWTFGILPIFIVRDLQMSKRIKIIVAGILGFAALGSTATVIRIPYVSTLGGTEDFLWSTTYFALWTTVEIGIGIVAACTATLRPLLQAITGKSQANSYQKPRTNAVLLNNPQERGRKCQRSMRKYQRSISVDSIQLRTFRSSEDILRPSKTSSVVAVDGSMIEESEGRAVDGHDSQRVSVDVTRSIDIFTNPSTIITQIKPKPVHLHPRAARR